MKHYSVNATHLISVFVLALCIFTGIAYLLKGSHNCPTADNFLFSDKDGVDFDYGILDLSKASFQNEESIALYNKITSEIGDLKSNNIQDDIQGKFDIEYAKIYAVNIDDFNSRKPLNIRFDRNRKIIINVLANQKVLNYLDSSAINKATSENDIKIQYCISCDKTSNISLILLCEKNKSTNCLDEFNIISNEWGDVNNYNRNGDEVINLNGSVDFIRKLSRERASNHIAKSKSVPDDLYDTFFNGKIYYFSQYQIVNESKIISGIPPKLYGDFYTIYNSGNNINKALCIVKEQASDTATANVINACLLRVIFPSLSISANMKTMLPNYNFANGNIAKIWSKIDTASDLNNEINCIDKH